MAKLEIGVNGVADDQYYNSGLLNILSDPLYSTMCENSRYDHGSTIQVQIGLEKYSCQINRRCNSRLSREQCGPTVAD